MLSCGDREMNNIGPNSNNASESTKTTTADAERADDFDPWTVYEAGKKAAKEGDFEQAVDIFSSVLESL